MKFQKSLSNAALVLFVALVGTGAALAQDGPNYIYFATDTGHISFDLNNPGHVKDLRDSFSDDPMVSSCFVKADNAIAFMKERDAGVTLEEHLAKLEARYEATKDEPEGAVPWHVYLDVGRMVRDIHRSAGANAKGEFRFSDPRELWNREFKWCAIPTNF